MFAIMIAAVNPDLPRLLCNCVNSELKIKKLF